MLLDLTGDDAKELNVFHPMMSFTQTMVDPIDPLVYMRYIVQEPRNGGAPKSIYQTEGMNPDGTGDYLRAAARHRGRLDGDRPADPITPRCTSASKRRGAGSAT